MKIAVIGGGAAGFFAAIHASSSGCEVEIFEKSSKVLSKVKVSGGGRCNVTHQPMEISKLVKNYPRGEKFLKRVFRKFSSAHTISWFESHGVPLKVEKDGRMFPVSDSSQTVIDALLREVQKLKVEVKLSCAVDAIRLMESGFELKTSKGTFEFDRLIIATGGHPKLTGYGFLAGLKHQVLAPIPSLFTFNTPRESLKELMGLSVGNGIVKLAGTKFTYQGPILVTHWGISGPAVLKLSAFGAKWLQESDYQATAIIQWNANFGEEALQSNLKSFALKHPNKKVSTNALFDIPGRLWEHFCHKAEIDADQVYGSLGKKQLNKLVQNLFCYNLKVEGKTTFKEEFVTAGGVSLEGVNPETMESKYHPNLYFAGEVLDLDGITGGFNFQAAWSTGFLAGISSPN
ncbi:NAD(P)/FAD-dependent oxidoreductase [Algoriphagus halophytocola]|uniref:NAD(P)/FAD-dependent oxidoreductase n=1 Tax=Algoriphagus halophytocola TaxID=2991499 RepID=A0ABY6MLF7_9BACT|nr:MULTISPECIES: NAD(P)/FAD-dependent oxidoreductase [unclassified Algoriphagus]UZD23521.1 NAD(P)/FAD-dependent oxidoreductase [Algoriphagus sp. TR-M5]WBL44815.1 NAD(P)/FAD-dependent oxidoreductase [Algoriphagus sp. TR-M9]